MQSQDFPDCCAFIIINKFKGGHPTADPDTCSSPEEVNTYLQTQERKHYSERTGLLVALTRNQREKVGFVLEDRKYEILLDDIHNPRTGNFVTLYFRNLNPTLARKRRIFGGN